MNKVGKKAAHQVALWKCNVSLEFSIISTAAHPSLFVHVTVSMSLFCMQHAKCNNISSKVSALSVNLTPFPSPYSPRNLKRKWIATNIEY